MIEFVAPTFNEFTLNFPKPTPEEVEQAVYSVLRSAAHGRIASKRTKNNAVNRRVDRQIRRQYAVIVGGFISYPPNLRTEVVYSTARAEQRRAKFGRKQCAHS